MDNFKVLALDGGGVRGYLSILILERIEKALQEHFKDNKLLYERFDLIVGTSTGGIIAAGLAIGKSAKEIRILYEELLDKIFTQPLDGIKTPKYNHNILKKELEKIVKNKTLNDVKTPLCLTSVDISTFSPRFFKSPYLENFKPRADEKILDALLATSAAPIFFPLVDTKYSHYLADGGLVANNPTMIGITDAYRITKDLKKIKLLSIGTGKMTQVPYDIEKIKQGGGILSWTLDCKGFGESSLLFLKKQMVIPLIEVLLNTQSSLINSHANLLLGENFLRINPELSVPINLDEVDKINVLKNLAIKADKKNLKDKIINLIS